MKDKVSLKEICVDLSDGLHAAPVFDPDGEYLFVNANNMVDGCIRDIGNGKRANKEEYEKYKIELDNQTLFYSIDGTIGNVAKYHGEKCILGKGACYLRLKPEISRDYIYYLLQSDLFTGYIRSMQTGSTIHHISLETMRSFKFLLPDRDTQDRLVIIPTALDAKISHNKAICSILEQTTKTLYEYWFTQFDFPDAEGKPYRTSGGTMEWNEQLKHEIPKGWKVGNLYRIADYVNDLACQKHRPKEGEGSLPVIKITEMHSGITNKTEAVSESIPDKYKIYDGDILFSWSATLEIMYWFGGAGGLNQHIFKVVPKDGFPKEYVYQQLSAYIVNFVKMAEARKTTMGHITTDHLDQSRIAIPPTPVLERFSEIVRPIHEMIGKYQQQNRELTKLRDWLLPMLMNGQAVVE